MEDAIALNCLFTSSNFTLKHEQAADPASEELCCGVGDAPTGHDRYGPPFYNTGAGRGSGGATPGLAASSKSAVSFDFCGVFAGCADALSGPRPQIPESGGLAARPARHDQGWKAEGPRPLEGARGAAGVGGWTLAFDAVTRCFIMYAVSRLGNGCFVSLSPSVFSLVHSLQLVGCHRRACIEAGPSRSEIVS